MAHRTYGTFGLYGGRDRKDGWLWRRLGSLRMLSTNALLKKIVPLPWQPKYHRESVERAA